MTTGREEPVVLSASRRTDIPAFYMNWFMAGIGKRSFEVVNPYNRRVSRVPASPREVHSIVFWSKDFGPFIAGGYGQRLERDGYRLCFNFTVNSPSAVLEPHVPPLAARLDQMRALCDRYGPRAVAWRFDPVVFFKAGDGVERSNLDGFERIAGVAAECGVERCITSFMDDYAKIRRRVAARPGFAFVDPPADRKIAVLKRMRDVVAPGGMRLETCCEKTLLEGLSGEAGIRAAACVSHRRLTALYGGCLADKKDRGQRVSRGCRCRVSVDVGSYALHPCYHNCLFCYANPSDPSSRGAL